MFRFMLLAAMSCGFAATSVADPVTFYLEEFGDLGTDLSDTHSAPTALGSLPLGESLVAGFIENAERSDIDIFTFTVDANLALDSILLSVDGDRHFLAIAEGTQISPTESNTMLTARLISSSQANDNLLTNDDPFAPDTLGISAPLGPGDYTIWLQETQFETFGYAFTFQTSTITAIPEASSGFLLVALGTSLGLRRKRRR